MIRWRLRQVMAEKGVWSAQDLVRLLEERAGIILSHRAVTELVNRTPRAVRFTTLEALCVALDVQPPDIMEYVPEKTKKNQAVVGGEVHAIAPYKRGRKPHTSVYPEEDF